MSHDPNIIAFQRTDLRAPTLRTDNTTNVHNAPVTTIHRADNVNVNLVVDEGELERRLKSFNLAQSLSDLVLLDRLPKQPDTSSEWADYLGGSRDQEIGEIWNWVNNPGTGQLVLWIHAPAGLGKSTLARQLKHELQRHGRLGAAIFLSQLPLDSCGPETIVRLIGAEIGRTHRRAVSAIAEAVRTCHGASLETQLEKFILNPLCSLSLQEPLVILLDAVDEWRSSHHFVEQLRLFTPHASLVRFILLGRSEPRNHLHRYASIQPYALRPASEEVLQKYVERRFERVMWEYGRRPGTQEIMELVTMAEGLFVWLSTACSLLENTLSSPQEALTAILYYRKGIGHRSHLADLYSKALGLLFPHPEGQNDLGLFFGLTMVLREPLPIEAFSSLSGISVYTLKRITSTLLALQIRRPGDFDVMIYPAVTLFHASFVEYLRTSSRDSDVAFPISPYLSHSHLSEACLRQLFSFLPTSRTLKTLYLSAVQKYMVKYWAWHLSMGTPATTPNDDGKWMKTPHSFIIRHDATLPLLLQWAFLYLKQHRPIEGYEDPPVDDVPSLMCAVASSLGGTVEDVILFKIPCLEVAVRLGHRDAANWRRLGSAYSRIADLIDLPDPIHRAVIAHQHAVYIARKARLRECAPYLYSLAYSLGTRATRVGAMEDLEKSILLLEDSLSNHCANLEDRSNALSLLAMCLGKRFNRLGRVQDLEQAIEINREVLSLCQHPDSFALNNLATSLHHRFMRLGSVSNLEESISLFREVLVLRPPGHLQRSYTLNSLASSLDDRSTNLGSIGDLEEAISLYREALQLRPKGHPKRPDTLNDLAGALYKRFKGTGAIGDVEESIALIREALALDPPGSPDRAPSLGGLAVFLKARYTVTGFFGDLEEAMSLDKEALSLCPPGHPRRSGQLANMAVTLYLYFMKSGSRTYMEEAIALQREAVALCPLGHPDRSDRLRNLATALSNRFRVLGSPGDGDEAVALLREAEECAR
ncbi:hypothetical protein NMY22_g6731 [Coprinellus aureogranulatus]|nr:hypothetical protein NMY22_g6731 [Coprinellus aureogranulatus]